MIDEVQPDEGDRLLICSDGAFELALSEMNSMDEVWRIGASGNDHSLTSVLLQDGILVISEEDRLLYMDVMATFPKWTEKSLGFERNSSYLTLGNRFEIAPHHDQMAIYYSFAES